MSWLRELFARPTAPPDDGATMGVGAEVGMTIVSRRVHQGLGHCATCDRVVMLTKFVHEAEPPEDYEGPLVTYTCEFGHTQPS